MGIPTRSDVIKMAKEEGKPIVAVLPVHYPRELFSSFGVYTMEIWGPPGIDTASASVHLQSYVCSVVHSALVFLKGHFDDVDMVIVPHSCDSLQGFGSLLIDFVNLGRPVYPLYLPRNGGRNGEEFLREEILNLCDRIASVTGYKPSDDDFMEAVLREEEVDEKLLEAYKLRRGVTGHSLEFYRILRAREYLPPNMFLGVLSDYMKVIDSSSGAQGVGVVISGVVPEPMDVLDEVDELGGTVVGDDFMCLRRRIYGKGRSPDPFLRMAQRLLGGPPDSTMGSSLRERFSFLKDVVVSSGASGVVFYHIKFCEPERFYQPMLKRMLREDGIDSVDIEVDINEPLPQQISMRLGAFIEALGGGL